MKICVMGLGYIGLPTALLFANHGFIVHGVDINEEIINKLKQMQTHIEEPGLLDMLKEAAATDRFTLSTQPEKSDVFIICVPTPITANKMADLSYTTNAIEMISPYLERGNLVVLESTVPPKTVTDIIVPILKETHLEIGKDIFVSHAPERILPGNLIKELIENDRVVGGINAISTQITVELYKKVIKGKIYTTDATTAELVKLIENTYRDVNIAFANELARISEKLGIDVWEAISLANRHPRVNILKPGPGVGGHCIAVDPYFIIEKAPLESLLIAAAREINSRTPYLIAHNVANLLQNIKEPKITLLGLAYKGNVGDIRESPSLFIHKELLNMGYEVKIYDPLVKEHYEGKIDNFDDAIKDSDCLVILTDHEAFKHLNAERVFKLLRNKLVVDTRKVLNKKELTAKGINYVSVGIPEFNFTP